jgi:hypothetical protein
MKALVKVLRFNSKHLHTEVSLLAILVAVLNLSSMPDVQDEKGQTIRVADGIENMQLVESLEDIIKNEALKYVNKSLALLTISNLYTMNQKVVISQDTKDFALYVLEHWKNLDEKEQVVMNLVYSSLTIFYNITLRKPSKEDAKNVI